MIKSRGGVGMKMNLSCRACGGVCDCEAGESLGGGGVRWYISSACGKCGAISEEDGAGFAPEMIREMLLERFGIWSLVFDGQGSKAGGAKVLRDELGVSALAALSFVTCDIESCWKGTQTEVQWLVGLLRGKGVDASAVLSKPKNQSEG